MRINGKDHYLGPWGTKASRTEYDRVVGEWQANGRRALTPADGKDPFVAEVLAAFWDHAKVYYRHPDGTPTSELKNFKHAMKPVRRLYGEKRVSEFGPLALKAVLEEMVRLGLARTNINRHLVRLKHIFKWAVGAELIPPAVHQALAVVLGLKAGRTKAKESASVTTVPESQVFAVRPFVSRPVWAAIELQHITGMRAGEVLSMRPVDIDRSVNPWEYKPPQHKTAYRGHTRAVFLGQRCQEILAPFLANRPDDAFLFSPAEAEAERRARLAAARKTPLSCGNKAGTNKAKKPKKAPGNRYSVESYDAATKKACRKAFPPPPELADDPAKVKEWHKAHTWRAHQLRHNVATKVRKAHGIEAVRQVLGQKSVPVAELYAEEDRSVAAKVMSAAG